MNGFYDEELTKQYRDGRMGFIDWTGPEEEIGQYHRGTHKDYCIASYSREFAFAKQTKEGYYEGRDKAMLWYDRILHKDGTKGLIIQGSEEVIY